MLIPCAECRQQISEDAQACPQCGRPIRAEDRAKAKALANAETRAQKVRYSVLIVLVIVLAFLMSGAWQQTPSSQAEPAPQADDVRLEIVELKATATGVSVKVAAENVSRVGARVALWPYVTLTDGTRVGRSLWDGPVFLDIEAGKRSFVLAPIALTLRQVPYAQGYGIEQADISRLDDDPLTPQLPGRPPSPPQNP